MHARYTFVDTSVLVPACVPAHPAHGKAVTALRSVLSHPDAFVMSAHSLLEIYSTLTTLPVRPRLGAAHARSLIADFERQARVVALTPMEYMHVVEHCAAQGLTGAVVYDALHAAVARKVGVERLLTFNPADFMRVWPEAEGIIVSA